MDIVDIISKYVLSYSISVQVPAVGLLSDLIKLLLT